MDFIKRIEEERMERRIIHRVCKMSELMEIIRDRMEIEAIRSPNTYEFIFSLLYGTTHSNN